MKKSSRDFRKYWRPYFKQWQVDMGKFNYFENFSQYLHHMGAWERSVFNFPAIEKCESYQRRHRQALEIMERRNVRELHESL